MYSPRQFGIVLSLIVAGAALPRDAFAATWSNAGFAPPPRNAHVAERLPDGRVLVAGGAWGEGDGNYASALLFDPKTGAWSTTSSMNEGRAVASSAVLKDGRVLVVGGARRELDGTLASSEIYSPSTGSWSVAASLTYPRFWPACVTLADGRVLAAGGSPTPDTDSAHAEVFDPSTNTWTTSPSMPVMTHTPRGALLPSGHAVVVGGAAISEFDPISNTWVSSVPLPSPLRVAIAVLADGRLLIAGEGTPASVIYDPMTRTVTPTGSFREKTRGAPKMVTLPDGRVLAVGGVGSGDKQLATAELFDPKTKTWTMIDALPDGTGLHTATPLADGRVLVVGAGATLSMPAQIFNAVDGTTCSRNDDCISGYCTDGVCCNVPCGGACETCDSKDHKGVCSPISGTPRVGHSSCAPFLACTEGACDSTCSADSDCSTGNVCFPELKRCGPDRNLCGPNDTIVDRKTGQATSCAPYTCSPLGTCTSECATSLDCAAGFICQAPACVAAPSRPSEEDDGGCATSRGSRTTTTGGGLILLAAIGLLQRRRARRAGLPLCALTLALLASGCSVGAEGAAEEEPITGNTTSALEWSAGGAMQSPVRVYHSATVLTDGRVLVAGGSGASVMNTVEVFDPASEKWAPLAAMKRARAGHSATLLTDGRLLVTGGQDAMGKQLSSAELYDPAANAWSEAAMTTPRETHISVQLADGRVLVSGGARATSSPVASAELFDPATSTWSATGSMSSKRVFAAAHLLEDGRVLVAGGEGGAKTTELFVPATGTWMSGPELPSANVAGSLLRIGKGRLVLIGGTAKTAQMLDESSMTWRAAAATTAARQDSVSVPLTNGQIAVLGGEDGSAVHDTYALYDPIADQWAAPRRMTVPRFAHTASLLPSGRVLIVGGLGTLTGDLPLVAPPEILNLGNGAACTKDLECTTGFCVDGVCCDRWCSGSCEACNLPGKIGVCSPVTGTPQPARDGVGPRRRSCSPYGMCIEGACATSCAADSYCDESHICNASTQTCVEPVATCDGASTVTEKLTGATKSCAPYRCMSNGSCRTKCSSSDECAAGAACDGNTCVVITGAPDEGGCSVAHTQRSQSSLVGGIAVAVAAALGLRRRRNSRAIANEPA